MPISKSASKKNEIKDQLSHSKLSFRSVAVFSGIINVLMLAPAIYMLQVYDRVISSGNEITLYMLTAIVVVIFVFMGTLETLRTYILIRVSQNFDYNLRGRIYIAAFERNRKGETQEASQALQDLATVRHFITGPGLFALFDAPWFPLYLIIIFMFNIWLGVLSVVGALLLVLLAWFNHKVTTRPLSQASTLSIAAGHMASSTLRNSEVISSMGMLNDMRGRWEKLHQEYMNQQNIASERAAITANAGKYFRLLLQSLVLGLGAWLVINGKMTSGMMIAGSILMGKALGPIDQLIGISKTLGSTRSAYERINILLQSSTLSQSSMKLPDPKGVLSLEHVFAGPPSEVETLHDINLTIPVGTTVGVVGPSGSGKSTLAKIILGIWPTTQGSVRLDDAEIKHYRSCELGPKIGYLPQDIELFAGTIAQNIARFGNIDPEKVTTAAKMAGIHELILRFKDGYDTLLNDGGTGVSGGQRQRIALARALYDLPVLVVLDEPNSNLDEHGELALIEAVNILKNNGRTVILVTHKVNILSCVDKILILNDGKVQSYVNSEDVLFSTKDSKTSKSDMPPPNDYAYRGYFKSTPPSTTEK